MSVFPFVTFTPAPLQKWKEATDHIMLPRILIELRLGGPAQKCVQIPTWGRLVSPRGEEGRPLTGVCFRPSHANQLQALLTMGLNIPYHQPIYEACVHDLLAGVVDFSTVPSKDARRTCVSILQLIPHPTVSLLLSFLTSTGR